ncbi:hypothetical protein BH09VER1_BH09VER1_28780 [soil metagenome]
MKPQNVQMILFLSCILAAAAVAISGTEGWGWFLFVAVLTLMVSAQKVK